MEVQLIRIHAHIFERDKFWAVEFVRYNEWTLGARLSDLHAVGTKSFA
jgi:hypothetical protein